MATPNGTELMLSKIHFTHQLSVICTQNQHYTKSRHNEIHESSMHAYGYKASIIVFDKMTTS